MEFPTDPWVDQRSRVRNSDALGLTAWCQVLQGESVINVPVYHGANCTYWYLRGGCNNRRASGWRDACDLFAAPTGRGEVMSLSWSLLLLARGWYLELSEGVRR